MNTDYVLQLKNISVRYGGVRALDGINISLTAGEIVALIGPNGAGKSTILKVIFGLAPTYSGHVFWQNQVIKPVPHELVRRGISYVPQGRQVFSNLSIQENLEIGGYSVRDKRLLQRRIFEVIEMFPVLKRRRYAAAGTLSGGQQQMLALARGLINEPQVLLLDEPSLGLAPKIVTEVFTKIKEINEKHKTAIMVVEHNIKSLFEIASRGYVLDKGHVAAQDTSHNLLKCGVVEKLFLGKPI